MATSSKTAKSGSAKKAQVKVGDLKPAKDAKGGGRRAASRGASANNRRYNVN